MHWHKLGLIFCSSGQKPWMASHASIPFAERMEGDLYRIYFTSRDAQNRSHISWLELDITRPDKIIRLSESPIIAPGAPGRFDDCGAAAGWIVHHEGKRHLYYVGYNVPKTVPFHVSIGLAHCNDGDNFIAPAGPIIDRSRVDPYFVSGPCVLIENGLWRMWYLSGLGWAKNYKTSAAASYDIRYVESDDGVNWNCTGQTAISLGDDYAIARPCVLRERDGGYSMWYCMRTQNGPYRLGFARSSDGLAWTRDDANSGMQIFDDGLHGTIHRVLAGGRTWDSEMIAYPYVFDHGAERYMLYNGGDYGRTGFGIAVCQN